MAFSFAQAAALEPVCSALQCALTSSVKPGAMMVKMAGPIACPKLTGSHLKNSAARNSCLTPRGCGITRVH